jgi:uncharacterized protein YlxP (DUF503 family)
MIFSIGASLPFRFRGNQEAGGDALMIIGALRLSFLVPQDGRSTRGLGQKVRVALNSRFKASAVELELKTNRDTELTIGASVVSPDETQMRKKIDQIIGYFQEWGHAELVYQESEIIHFDDIDIERDFEKYDP